MTYIGIDPGLKGSIAVLNGDLTVIPTPTVKIGKKNHYDVAQMKHVLQSAMDGDCFVVIERVHAMPGQGVTSMFRFGEGYGIWIGLIVALGLPYDTIAPRTWCGVMLKGISGDGKERNYLRARQLYPNWEPKYKYEKEYADSILLAEYGKRIYGGKNG